MPLSVGAKLGAYEILAPIGAGGMGEVYRARDTKLKRDVALKVLPNTFANDPERMARFQREAEVLASLNHPNIAAIYGVEERALVMELVEGQTLKGPLPLETALDYARQTANALEAAHEKGIVHRDLKPANVMITVGGLVKVLDFGLAAVMQGPAGDPANSPTLTMRATETGVIMGTAGYMSPEQASGKPVDKRADIFSFGVVLWEMLTGKRLFDGETVSHTLAAVLTKDPDWKQLPGRTPAAIRTLLRRCLDRDVRKRLRDIGEARVAIEEALAGGPEAATAPSRSPGPGRRLGWLAAMLALALGALAFVHFREQPPVAELTRFQIPLPANENLPPTSSVQEVSPDGRKLAFVALGADSKWRLWIRSLDSLDSRLLPDAETAAANVPFFWSADSRFIAFLSPDHKLKKVDVAGGPAQTLCDAVDLVGGSWSRDGVILFAEGSQNGVKRVSEAGGMATALTALDSSRKEVGHLFPKLLPDGRHFLYFRDSTIRENRGIYVGSIDAKPSQQSNKPLLMNEALTEYYVPSGNSRKGHLLFYREGTVLAQPFDPNKLELSGDPVPVAEQVGNVLGILGFFSASTNGVLTYLGGNSSGNIQLTWFDRQGKNLGTVGEPGFLRTLALSRDGKHAAVSRIDSRTKLRGNLWLLDLMRGGPSTRFTFDASYDSYPVWSPDGSRIVFMSSRDGPGNLYQKLTSGAKDEVPLLKSDEPKFPSSWSLDGRFLLYTVQRQGKDELWIVPMGGTQKPMLFQGPEFNEIGAQFSPDGRWIAYGAYESGRYEVYVREFSLGSDGKPEATAKHQISMGGGYPFHWLDSGKELIYGTLDGKLMSVEITTKPIFQVSPATALFQVPVPAGGYNTVPGVTGDGKRFLVAMPVGPSGPQQFTVVQNWQAGLKK